MKANLKTATTFVKKTEYESSHQIRKNENETRGTRNLKDNCNSVSDAEHYDVIVGISLHLR